VDSHRDPRAEHEPQSRFALRTFYGRSGAASFTVTVNEINQPPVLTAPASQTIDPSSLTATLSAADPDLPANSQAFALLSGPAGMAVDPATGAMSWTPSAAQGAAPTTLP